MGSEFSLVEKTLEHDIEVAGQSMQCRVGGTAILTCEFDLPSKHLQRNDKLSLDHTSRPSLGLALLKTCITSSWQSECPITACN